MLVLFKKEPLLRYVFPPYQPVLSYRQTMEVNVNANLADANQRVGMSTDLSTEKDAVQIDKLYLSL